MHPQDPLARNHQRLRTMTANKARAHWNLNKKKPMGLYWSHTPETDIHHYTTSPNVESTGKEEERKTEKMLREQPHRRHWGSVTQRERLREVDRRWKTVDGGLRPGGCNGLSKLVSMFLFDVFKYNERNTIKVFDLRTDTLCWRLRRRRMFREVHRCILRKVTHSLFVSWSKNSSTLASFAFAPSHNETIAPGTILANNVS